MYRFLRFHSRVMRVSPRPANNDKMFELYDMRSNFGIPIRDRHDWTVSFVVMTIDNSPFRYIMQHKRARKTFVIQVHTRRLITLRLCRSRRLDTRYHGDHPVSLVIKHTFRWIIHIFDRLLICLAPRVFVRFSFAPYKTPYFLFAFVCVWTMDHSRWPRLRRGNVTTTTNAMRRSPSMPAATVYVLGALALWRLSRTGCAATDDPVSDRCRIPNVDVTIRKKKSRYFSPLYSNPKRTKRMRPISSRIFK